MENIENAPEDYPEMSQGLIDILKQDGTSNLEVLAIALDMVRALVKEVKDASRHAHTIEAVEARNDLVTAVAVQLIDATHDILCSADDLAEDRVVM